MSVFPDVSPIAKTKAEKFAKELKLIHDYGLDRQVFSAVGLFTRLMAQGKCTREDIDEMRTLKLDPITPSIDFFKLTLTSGDRICSHL